MAKIDKLKNKLRYNKDLGYQLTGKDLKILIDHINGLEETIINNTITELVQQETVIVDPSQISVIDLTGVMLKQETYNFIVLGVTLNFAPEFDSSSNPLVFNNGFQSSQEYFRIPAVTLLTPGTYLANLGSMASTNTFNLDIAQAPSNSNQTSLYFTITYLKIT